MKSMVFFLSFVSRGSNGLAMDRGYVHTLEQSKTSEELELKESHNRLSSDSDKGIFGCVLTKGGYLYLSLL